jgi:pimeloyl-ACP methyl ester carboxylesterase
MLDAGFVVYAPDYRGWGASSPGLPDEEGIHADAWTAWQQVRGRHQRWVIYGHSMGGAVAAHLTARMGGASPEVCALVLESTFPSFERVAAQSVGGLGVVLTRMSRQRMNTAAALRSVAVPVRVWHGSADRTVDVSLGRELFDAIGAPKVWETWPLDHSNLQDDPSGRYAQRWRELAQECPLRP